MFLWVVFFFRRRVVVFNSLWDPEGCRNGGAGSIIQLSTHLADRLTKRTFFQTNMKHRAWSRKFVPLKHVKGGLRLRSGWRFVFLVVLSSLTLLRPARELLIHFSWFHLQIQIFVQFGHFFLFYTLTIFGQACLSSGLLKSVLTCWL